jgi:hypothetical protein
VSLTRGREKAEIFTDDKDELLKAMSRSDDPMSATNLAESTKQKPDGRDRQSKTMLNARGLQAVARENNSIPQANAGQSAADKDMSHDR